MRWGTVSGLAGVPVAEEEKKSSSLEHLKILLPALSLIAYIVTQLSKHRTESKLLLGLTLVLLVGAYYPTVSRRLLLLLERRKDDAVARNAFPKFREMVHRFGEFIDSRTDNTLHAIVPNEIFRHRADGPAAFRIPNRELWHGWWTYFWQRIDREHHTMDEMRAALMEFHLLVGSYANYCVSPIFDAPSNVKAEIPQEAKSSLNSFQQRFDRFAGEYGQFAKSLSESRPALHGLPYWISSPKPLA